MQGQGQRQEVDFLLFKEVVTLSERKHVEPLETVVGLVEKFEY